MTLDRAAAAFMLALLLTVVGLGVVVGRLWEREQTSLECSVRSAP